MKRVVSTAIMTLFSLFGLAVRGAIAASRASGTASSSVNVAKWLVIGSVAGGLTWWSNANPPADRYVEDDVLPEENPERVAALGGVSGLVMTLEDDSSSLNDPDAAAASSLPEAMPAEKMDDSFLLSDLQSRMQEIAKKTQDEDPKPPPPPDESGSGGTAMLERPPADGEGGPSSPADELPSPPPGEDWGVETEASEDAEKIDMLRRMFGETPPPDEK